MTPRIPVILLLASFLLCRSLAFAVSVDEPVLEVIPPPPAAALAIHGVTGTAASSGLPGLPTAASPVTATAASLHGLSAPGYVTAIAGNRSVLLSWYPSEGAKAVSGYLIYRGLSPSTLSLWPINKALVSDSNFSDSEANSEQGPKNRTTYYYRVRAFDLDGRLSPYSELVSAQPNGPLLPPGRVEAVAVDGKVVLNWTEPLSTGDADLAKLWVLQGESSGQLKPVTALAATERRWEETGLANGKAVYYALRSEDVNGKLSPDSPEVRAVPYQPVRAPQHLSALGVGDAVVRLKWDPPAQGGSFHVKGYNVYRATTAAVDFSQPPINKALIPGDKTRWEDDSDGSMEAPKMGTQYTYALVAVDSEDNPSPPSPTSTAGPVPSLTSLSTGPMEVFGDNSLSIQGRKTINVSQTWVVQNGSNSQYGGGGAGGFSLDQQLQVRLTGKVGRKIKVDVDYDDKAQATQQQKISVVYTGDQQEVFKEFAFGDIQMDLGSGRSEFAPYNKSLFGAKLKLVSPDERLRLTAIGAQTKGYTETKRFVGGYEQVKTGNDPGRNIPDTAFTPYKFYYLTRARNVVEGADYIAVGSVHVFYDLPGITNNIPNHQVVTAANGTQLNLVEYVQGTDYLVDNASGLITFLDGHQPSAASNLVVAYKVQSPNSPATTAVGYNAAGNAVDLTTGLTSNYQTGITDASDRMIQFGSANGGQYDAHMSMQFYNLGDRDILPPSSDTDFKLNIYGTNQSLIYQLDPRADNSAVVEFDTRGGWIKFRRPYPFAKSTQDASGLTMDSGFTHAEDPLISSTDCYNSVSRINNFNIHIEYKHKLNSYSLRFNIIHGSELITLDGRRLTRDTDYFLDYDTGILVFSNPDMVKDTSVVEASYEYTPFAGQYTSTVWGARLEYDVTKDVSVGTSFLWNSADTPQDTPDVNSAPYSLQLLDGDVQLSMPQELLDALTRKIPGLPAHSGVVKVKANVEAAHSWLNPNTYSRNNENGVAMVDNFESVNAVVGISLDDVNWMPAAIPLRNNGDTGPAPSERRFSLLTTATHPSWDNQNGIVTQNQDSNKSQLVLHYSNMNTVSRWDAFMYSFGTSPNLSVAKSDQLQIHYYADHPLTLHVDVGEMSEDAVGTGVLATESTTGIISTGQDIGLLNPFTQGTSPYPLPPAGPDAFYYNPNYWGRGNNRLDTEDLDGNGALNLNYNNYYSFVVPLDATTGAGADKLAAKVLDLANPSAIISSGLAMSTVLGSPNYYTNIKRVRFWIDGCAASDGEFRLETFQFTGNNWQLRSDPNLFSFVGQTITADVNAFKVTGVKGSGSILTDFPVAYVPDTNFFATGNGTSALNEQALQVRYRLDNLEQVAGHPYYQAYRLLGNGTKVDMGGYKTLRLDLYKPLNTQPGERFLIRLATDDSNYFEYSIPLDSISINGWQTVQLALDGSDGRRIQVGFPYLRQVGYCAIMVDNPNPPSVHGFDSSYGPEFAGSEVLWLDNLRVTDSISRDGSAAKAILTYDFFNGGLIVNHSIRDVESDFVMMDHQGDLPARHSVSQVIDAKINALKDVPMGVRYEENRLFTDPSRVGDPNYSHSFVDPDQTDQKTTASLGINRVPYVPGFTVNSSGFTQHIRQIYLPDEIRQIQLNQGETITPNTDLNNQHLSVETVYKAPGKAWVFANDELRFETDYDENAVNLDVPSVNPANLAYRDQDRKTYTFRGRYTGSYRWGRWLTLSPSYAYTLVQAAGTLPVPTNYQGTAYYTLDASGRSIGDGAWGLPQTRAINPSLVLQFADLLALRAPKLAYNFTQTRDYIRNELRSPGSVDMSTSLAMANLGPIFKAWPAIDLSESLQVDSVVNNDLRIRSDQHTQQLYSYLAASPDGFGGRYDLSNLQVMPNIALAEQAPWYEQTWWVRMGGSGGLGEDYNDPLNIENIAVSASKRAVSNVSTRFDYALVPGWNATWSPHFNQTDARTMSAPEQVTRSNQWGAGIGADIREPHIPYWQVLHPSNLSLGYDFSNADNYVEGQDEFLTSNRISNTLRFTLPTKPTEKTALTFSVNWTSSTDKNYTPGSSDLTSQNDSDLWEPDLKLVYYLTIDHSYKMWDLWPFYGRELRVKQNFRLDNDLDVQLRSGRQTLTTTGGSDSSSKTYTLRDVLSYDALNNVKVNFSLEQKLYNNDYAADAVNQSGNYYSVKLSLGVEATF